MHVIIIQHQRNREHAMFLIIVLNTRLDTLLDT